MAYSFLTLAQCRAELLSRLNSTGSDFWTTAELNEYISEALSFWNVLTQWWPSDFLFDADQDSPTWLPINVSGSPRQRTYTESDLYSILLYHLLEPQLSGGTYVGTPQFDLSNLQVSAQNKLNEMMQKTTCNIQANTSLSILPNTNTVALPDTMLDVRRVRYEGVDGTTATLTRGDLLSFLRFSPTYRQTWGTPARWDVLASPPLTLTFDKNPNQPNTLEMLVMEAAPTLDPASPVLLNIPNDWMWVLKYGVLADLLTNAPEATDQVRADYCQKRYEMGLQLMEALPWILDVSFVNEVSVDTPPVISKDRYSYEWQANPNTWPGVVVAGMDLVALAPTPTGNTSVRIRVVGNAPQPVDDASEIQAPRDVIDVLLDYAQHLAAFKQGGVDFIGTISLYENLVKYAQDTSSRLAKSGIFPSDIRPQVSRQDLNEPRHSVKVGGV